MKNYQPSELANSMVWYLGCPCEVFPPMEDDDPLFDAYFAARREGAEEGFWPVLIKVDETLWECLTMNVDEENGEDFEMDSVRAYRKKMLEETVIPEGEAYFRELMSSMRGEWEAGGLDWEKEMLSEFEEGEENERFTSYWNIQTEKTGEVILAKIPVKMPWEVFAWLPFGNWNECPDTPELMAAAKYWFERHGAVPGAISHDELEFFLEKAVEDVEAAKRLAQEQYVFCPDLVEQCEEDGSVGKLASTLIKSRFWYFWWD